MKSEGFDLNRLLQKHRADRLMDTHYVLEDVSLFELGISTMIMHAPWTIVAFSLDTSCRGISYAQVFGSAPKLKSLSYVTEKSPPTVVIHGTDDRCVLIDLSLMVASRLKKLGSFASSLLCLGQITPLNIFATAADTESSKLWSTSLSTTLVHLDELASSDGKAQRRYIGFHLALLFMCFPTTHTHQNFIVQQNTRF
jgi:hypothetical protein